MSPFGVTAVTGASPFGVQIDSRTMAVRLAHHKTGFGLTARCESAPGRLFWA